MSYATPILGLGPSMPTSGVVAAPNRTCRGNRPIDERSPIAAIPRSARIAAGFPGGGGENSAKDWGT
jgi:hypothetical protein